MFRPFAEKPLSEVNADDIRGLVSRSIEEGHFIEYKSKWEPQKVARAVASFANTHGGTLVVGVHAPNRIPERVTPIEHHGELEDDVIKTIRASVDPVPAFIPQVVQFPNSRACLLVEVPEGTQPPYLWMSKGQILVRAGSSSEPIPANDRETIDRLYARGRRGLEWAKARIAELRQELILRHETTHDPLVAVHLVTVPAVADGLDAAAVVFSRGFDEDVDAKVTKGLPLDIQHRHLGGPPSRSMRGGASSMEWQAALVGAVIRFRAEITGVLHFSLEGQGNRNSWVGWLDACLPEALLIQQAVLVEHLGHRGTVGVAILAAEALTPGLYTVCPNQVALAIPVPIEELSHSDFRKSLDRSVTRFQGYVAYEP